MTRADELRQRYLSEAVQTSTPAGRLTMLFDALELDLLKADRAFDSADMKMISDCLIHAQDILQLLRSTIDTTSWAPAARIQALYDYLYTELVKANLEKDRSRVAAAAPHISQLAAAWRQAAQQVDAPAGQPATVG
ncbi:MAG TPA: flagellar export chaperone FliS [Acidimicrobiales bacterium]|nr:flagellar export chaperone FliS [Acidimicrobiales bacterium]